MSELGNFEFGSDFFFFFFFGNDFFEMMPKSQTTKEKLDEMDFIKIKNYCSSKDTINKVKKIRVWKKISANHISNKGLS